MIPFETVDILFIKLKEVYGNPYYKNHIIEKFKELKIGTKSFNTFYSEFIKLAVKLKFKKKDIIAKIYA